MKRERSLKTLTPLLATLLVTLLAGCGGQYAPQEGQTEGQPKTQFKTETQVRRDADRAELKRAQTREVGGIEQGQKPKPAAPKIQRVAVLELRNMARLETGEVRYLSNLLRQAAGRLPQSRFLVMTNDSLEALLPPEVDLESCEDTCPIEIGRTIQADWLLVGEVVKFGRTLRVSLNLHNVESGALTDSATVKGKDAESLEGPLQGTAVGLFSALDPSLKRTADRLKRGFVFQRFQYEALPSIPESGSSSESSESEQSVEVPERLNAQGISGAQFGSADLDALEIYERAVKSDSDESVSPEEKVKRWEAAASRMPSIASEARSRASAWRDFIKRRDAARARREAERARRAAQIATALKRLRRLSEEDAALEAKRSAQLEKDWQKLQRFLRLSVVSEADKLSWVEAFVEAYGAARELNPHIGELSEWTGRLGARFAELEREGRAEAQRRRSRADDIKQKIEELEGYERDVAKAQSLGLTLEAYRAQERERAERAERAQRLAREIGMRWVTVPGGSFMMGSNDGRGYEKPVHRVSVSAFRIAESEVTVRQYRKCVEAGVCTEPSTNYSKCTWGKSGYDNHPINCVDWGQARTFSRWVGGDLPTEAQWEYAARGGQGFKYAGSNDVSAVGWYGESYSSGSTHPVKRKRKNGYGLYDMSGNVWEWTLDEWHGSYSGAPSNGDQPWGSIPTCNTVCDKGPSRRVIRGGGWYHRAGYLRVVIRAYGDPDIRRYLGFRPAGPVR